MRTNVEMRNVLTQRNRSMALARDMKVTGAPVEHVASLVRAARAAQRDVFRTGRYDGLIARSTAQTR